LKDVGRNETVRTGGENPLTICVGHGKEDSREPGWRLVAGSSCRFPARATGNRERQRHYGDGERDGTEML
jgi:hypothetical protein